MMVMMTCACNPSAGEAEASGALEFAGQAW